MPSDRIPKKFEVSDYQFGRELRLRTPGIYAMNCAVEILAFLDSQTGMNIKNTGWKQGFGLKVAEPVPIQTGSLAAELETDGSEIIVRRVSGSADAFDQLCSSIRSRSPSQL